jgi:hypothetical protein
MFWEDYYHKHPTDAKRTADGKEVKFVTGDPLLDKWEDEIARGLEPDLTEGLSPKDRDKEMAARRKLDELELAAQNVADEIGDGFSETYGS